MSNKIWVLTYTIGTNEGRKSRRLICDTKAHAEMRQRVMGGDVVEYIRQPESFKVNWPEKIDIDEELEGEKQSIEELESHTVTLKMPHRNFGHPELFILCPFPYYDAEDMEKALASAGIKMEAE